MKIKSSSASSFTVILGDDSTKQVGVEPVDFTEEEYENSPHAQNLVRLRVLQIVPSEPKQLNQPEHANPVEE